MNVARFLHAGVASLALLCSIPAQAGCWAPAERESASVRELQTMLMVASLRCHAMGIDIVGDYNGFMRASRNTIEAANRTIKLHFAAAGGGQDEYDRFTTSLANTYGDDATDPAACAEAAATAHEAAGSADQLIHLAVNRVFPRTLPGGSCGGPVATATSLAAASPATIAAPPAAGRVVRLPDEVVAALTVMARYQGQRSTAMTAPSSAEAPSTQLAAMR